MAASSPPLHVAVAAIVSDGDEVLVALRPVDSHQGGLWEFPGGKVEAGESVPAALKRELQEELGIAPTQLSPLLKVQHHYADKSVLLDVWQVTDFAGEARGMEGQAIEWRHVSALCAGDFPAANVPIIRLLQLPRELAISPACATLKDLLDYVERTLASGVRLLQLRQHHLDLHTYCQWYEAAQELSRAAATTLIFNHEGVGLERVKADAFHAGSRQLMQLQARPPLSGRWFSAACHNIEQLRQAEALGADFVLLSPVAATDSHPGRTALGWAGFATLAAQVSLPVYALGGLRRDQLQEARSYGGFGIAGIRMYEARAGTDFG